MAGAGKSEMKIKLVRDSFTMPKLEYAQISGIKQRAIKRGQDVKKSEVLRAAVALLSGLDDDQLLAALKAVPSLKTGRPKREAPPAQADKPESAVKKYEPVKKGQRSSDGAASKGMNKAVAKKVAGKASGSSASESAKQATEKNAAKKAATPAKADKRGAAKKVVAKKVVAKKISTSKLTTKRVVGASLAVDKASTKPKSAPVKRKSPQRAVPLAEVKQTAPLVPLPEAGLPSAPEKSTSAT